MKIKLYFEKENLIRLAVAMVFAAVMFAYMADSKRTGNR